MDQRHKKRQGKVNHIENFRFTSNPFSFSRSEEMASHTRSNSLPSRPHPITSEFEVHLRRLRASEATTSSSISYQLAGLQDLHDSVNKLLLLPHTQQSLAQHQRESCIDVFLDGSLRLLDVCTTAKDALLQTKESTLALQSVLCRRHGGEKIRIEDGVKEYLASRKVVNKSISKALESLKGMERKTSFLINKDQESTIAILKEMEAVTFMVFESLFSFVSGTKPSKLGAWSLVSKLLKSKRIDCDEEQRKTNEFEDVDAALCIFIGCRASKFEDIGNMQNQLKSLELCVQDLEEELDSLCRNLIKTRVALLNIFSH